MTQEESSKSSEAELTATSVPEQPIQPMQTAPQVQYIVQEKSLNGIGGWLIFWLIVFGMGALGALWMFFVTLIAMITGVSSSGVGLAILIEMLIFSILMAGSYAVTTVFIAMSKKISVLLAYVSLGIAALYTTVTSITGMFATTQSCSYDYYSYSYSHNCVEQGIGAAGVIALIGAILAAWLFAFLVGLYFKLSKRVQLTLVK